MRVIRLNSTLHVHEAWDLEGAVLVPSRPIDVVQIHPNGSLANAILDVEELGEDFDGHIAIKLHGEDRFHTSNHHTHPEKLRLMGAGFGTAVALRRDKKEGQALYTTQWSRISAQRFDVGLQLVGAGGGGVNGNTFTQFDINGCRHALEVLGKANGNKVDGEIQTVEETESVILCDGDRTTLDFMIWDWRKHGEGKPALVLTESSSRTHTRLTGVGPDLVVDRGKFNSTLCDGRPYSPTGSIVREIVHHGRSSVNIRPGKSVSWTETVKGVEAGNAWLVDTVDWTAYPDVLVKLSGRVTGEDEVTLLAENTGDERRALTNEPWRLVCIEAHVP